MMRWQITVVLSAAAAVAITGAALVASGERIEADLAARATSVLAPETTSWATATVSGRDVALSGSAPSEDLREMAIDRVERVFGVRSVDSTATRLLPEQAPYVVSLTREGNALTISGSAPSLPDRRRMVAALTNAIPGLAYNDGLRLARGLPDAAYLDALSKLYPLLGELSGGTVTLTDRTVAVEGTAASNDAYGRLQHLDLGLPNGYELGRVALVRPVASPFVWSAASDGRRVTIAGVAPDADARLKLYGVVRAGARSGAVIDHVDLASGAPDGFTDVAAQAADMLDFLAFGSVEVRDRTVTITGTASTPETYRTANAYLAAFKPAGYTVDAKVDLPVVSPFTLSASKSGNNLTVTGFVPSEDVAGLVKAAAARVVGERNAVIETVVAAGAPEAFGDAAMLAFSMLENLKDGTVVLTGRKITVTGVAKSGSDLLDVEAASVSSVPQDFEVALQVTPPVVSPYVWAIEKKDDSIVITGSVPSETVRAAIRSMVEDAAGDLAVVDRTQIAAGLAPRVNLETVARFAMDELARLESGFLTLSDAKLSVLGRTSDPRLGMEVVASMDGRLPRAVQKGMVQIDFPPAFRLSIQRGLDAISIDGTAGDEAMRLRVAEAVRRAFGDADVEMNLTIMPGIPEGSADAAILAVRAASLFATGSVTIDGTTITAQGKAFTGIGAVRFSSDIAGDVPKGFRLDTSVGVAPAGPPLEGAACEAALTAVLARSAIYFESGSAVIAKDSHGLLDRLGAEAMRCKDATIVVEGHADSEGGADAAKTLSQARADAVAVFLATVGVDRARIQAKGFGAERPVADNATPEGRAKNRRIELHVTTGTTP